MSSGPLQPSHLFYMASCKAIYSSVMPVARPCSLPLYAIQAPQAADPLLWMLYTLLCALGAARFHNGMSR